MTDPQISTLSQLFDKITDGLSNGETLGSMSHVLESYSGNDWQAHATYSDRKTIFQNDHVELVVISWKKSQKISIHDHLEGGCIMKVMSGLLCEDKYSEYEEIYLSTTCLMEGSISYSRGNCILHQNNAMSDTVSIHIYSAPNYVPII